MSLPESVRPILESVIRQPTVARGLPLEFWRHPDHRAWIDAFTELAIALTQSDLDEASLPRGYVLIAYLFDWEAQCQFSGWHALENRRNELPAIFVAYEEVGLEGEAEALRRALQAWDASGGDHVAAGAAYNTTRHGYSVDLDRLEYLAGYFIDHADRLLYDAA
ncbi:hypothetical protein [Lysobacter panacisoli]|uniref:DUF4375 domain-containing protein n=1 Tax=Lysobacter panacisoli TaxID=1255263 RepID=A0ABP9LAM9_9GAMM|nr:hypothetical protein [Lysobacter panacisoli]